MDTMATALLRPGLLAGRTVALTAGAEEAIGEACAALGAATAPLVADPADEQAALTAARALGPVDALICDARAAWSAAGAGEPGLRAGADGAFLAARAVAVAGWIPAEGATAPPAGSPGGGPGARGGRLVLIAPAPGAGLHAGALRAALENLARTLSTEWARFAITPCAVLPGDATAPGELAALCAYLASEAGDYLSGTALTLGGSSPARP
jgi:NAD(P)-dependent dehydrogenase (short-subunit alcohol dehydrogenase family)